MNSMEFGLKCRELNIKYRDIFGEIPCPADFACGYDDFYKALVQSVQEEKKIENFIEKIAYPTEKNIII